MNHRAELDEFAQRYAKAWCSPESGKRSGFFAENGSSDIERRTADSGAGKRAQDSCNISGHDRDLRQTRAARRPNGISLDINRQSDAGTGNHVRISGYELWKIDNDGLIAESKGHFDAAEYERQLK